MNEYFCFFLQPSLFTNLTICSCGSPQLPSFAAWLPHRRRRSRVSASCTVSAPGRPGRSWARWSVARTRSCRRGPPCRRCSTARIWTTPSHRKKAKTTPASREKGGWAIDRVDVDEWLKLQRGLSCFKKSSYHNWSPAMGFKSTRNSSSHPTLFLRMILGSNCPELKHFNRMTYQQIVYMKFLVGVINITFSNCII